MQTFRRLTDQADTGEWAFPMFDKAEWSLNLNGR
jgi:hypothetical protein